MGAGECSSALSACSLALLLTLQLHVCLICSYSCLTFFLTPCILTVISDSQSEGLLQMNRGEISKES